MKTRVRNEGTIFVVEGRSALYHLMGELSVRIECLRFGVPGGCPERVDGVSLRGGSTSPDSSMAVMTSR